MSWNTFEHIVMERMMKNQLLLLRAYSAACKMGPAPTWDEVYDAIRETERMLPGMGVQK